MKTRYSLFLCTAIIMAIIMALGFLSACGNRQTAPAPSASPGAASERSEYDFMEYSYEAYIDLSTHIIRAEYLGEVPAYHGSEQQFRIEETYKGQTEEEIIHVVDSSREYEEGLSYVLFLNIRTSLYHPHDRYSPTVVSPSEKTDTAYIQTYLQSAAADKEDAETERRYTLSEDITEILADTPYVFEVRVGEVMVESVYAPTTIHYCEVLSVLKGKPVSSEIRVKFFNDTVKSGDELIVLLTSSSETSLLYTLSSLHSVYTPAEIEEIPALQELQKAVAALPPMFTYAGFPEAEQAYIAQQLITAPLQPGGT